MLRTPIVVLGILASMAPVLGAQAATVLALTVEELAEESDRVIRARVVSSRSEVDEALGMAFRTTTLEVLEDLVGHGPSRVELRQLGGEAGGLGAIIEGDASFELGEEVVLFVRAGRADGSLVHLEGLSLGKFRIERREGVPANAVRNLGGLRLLRPEGAKREIVNQLPLDELRLRVRSGTGRIELEETER